MVRTCCTRGSKGSACVCVCEGKPMSYLSIASCHMHTSFMLGSVYLLGPKTLAQPPLCKLLLAALRCSACT